jgi:hypothetical protein
MFKLGESAEHINRVDWCLTIGHVNISNEIRVTCHFKHRFRKLGHLIVCQHVELSSMVYIKGTYPVHISTF